MKCKDVTKGLEVTIYRLEKIFFKGKINFPGSFTYKSFYR